MAQSRNIETLYRLTPLQEGILFHTLQRADPGLYVGQYTCSIDAEVDPERLRLAWSELMRRHAVLRTLFAWKGREKPLQIVRERAELPWRYEDWSADDEASLDNRWQMLSETERERGFALDAAPLIRVALVRVAERRYRLSLCYHHIVLDGWSLKLLLDEAAALYATPAGCELTETRFADYVDWLLTRDTAHDEAFWAEQLGDLDSPTRMPFEVGAGDSRGYAAHGGMLDRKEVDKIAVVARNHRATTGTLLIAAWALLLGRYCDRDDVVFGTTWAGRPQELPGCQNTAGLFINTLPTRVRIDDDERAGQYLTRVQDLLVGIRAHEHTPLAQAQRGSAVAQGQALFDSLVVLQSVPETFPASRPWVPVDETFFEYSNYPLALLLRPGENFHVSLVYDRAHVTDADAEQLVAHYLNIVRSILAAPDAAVGELEMLAHDELEWLRDAGNGPRLELEPATVCEQMVDCAARSPEIPALVQDEDVLNYAELSARSSAIAGALRRIVGNVSRPVPGGFYGAVFLDRSPAALVAGFGVLEAGGSYVPLDPAYPGERSRLVLEDLEAADGPAVIVTERRLLSAVPATSVPVICIDDVEPVTEPPAPGGARDAYVMFTSGSTGRPKGTCVTQTNIVASTAARNLFYGEAPTRFLLLSSLATDSSIAGIFWTLTAGGTLVLPRPREEQSVASITATVRRQRITHLLCLPSLYALLLEHAEPGALDSLDTVIVAGEACPLDLVEEHHERLPSAKLFNEYGPSEASVWATVAELRRGDQEVTIGKPIANARTRVVDRRGRKVPIGIPGELWIGGAGVARGYLGRPELTASRFVADTEEPDARMYRSGDRVRLMRDGALRFLGRVDNQLKVRGHRVEPEEIEQRLTAQNEIRDAAVTLAADASGRERLTAFIVCHGQAPTITTLRERLGEMLPDFMLPQLLIAVDTLPRSPGGKLDAKALLDLARDATPRREFAAPTTETEALLADIWADILDVDRVGVDDDFFELGGDSLLSIRILARAHKAGLEISPAEFFARPTVAGQAKVATPRAAPADVKAKEAPKPFDLVNLDAAGLAAVTKQLGDAKD